MREKVSGKLLREERDDGSEVATKGQKEVRGRETRIERWRQNLGGK